MPARRTTGPGTIAGLSAADQQACLDWIDAPKREADQVAHVVLAINRLLEGQKVSAR